LLQLQRQTRRRTGMKPMSVLSPKVTEWKRGKNIYLIKFPINESRFNVTKVFN